jgi:hypothetical protein
MNRDDIIKLAREADPGFETDTFHAESIIGMEAIERFAALVREHLLSTEIHSCHANCERFACVQTRKAVEAEREACARVCDGWASYGSPPAATCAADIRARGRQ